LKPLIIYDITNLLALSAITAGSIAKWGWEIGVIISGIVALSINFFTISRLMRP
jgi:hypothetical protein